MYTRGEGSEQGKTVVTHKFLNSLLFMIEGIPFVSYVQNMATMVDTE